METTIFYFSATGNSLNLARNLSDRLGHCTLIPIADKINRDTVKVTSERVGFVFPVFAWGMPRIVEEFVGKLTIDGNPYIFAIASCVAIQGNTLRDLKKALRQRGAALHAGFAVKSGRSSLMKRNTLDGIIISLDRKRKKIRQDTERMEEVVEKIEQKIVARPETSSFAANIISGIFHKLALKTFKSTDSGFKVEDSCIACGNCAKLCPRANIVMENGRPTFLHNCELCHACIQWCPKFAIQHPNFDHSLDQYHNPEIQMKDLFLKKN